MFARFRMKRIFRSGASTYESSKLIREKKGIDMVHYLRARRALSNLTNALYHDVFAENKKYSRRQHLLRVRAGLPLIGMIW